MSSNSIASRDDLYKLIFRASSYGNLGLFIGTGFSMAVLNHGGTRVALSWNELLAKVSAELEINYKAIPSSGIGYPEVATLICDKYAEMNGKSYGEALSEVKRIISKLTSWYPEPEMQGRFGRYLASISPAWVITTNYDLVIEGILTGNSIPLGPSDLLTNPKGAIPVYHLHGLRTNPEEIVISQEDYVALFRPNQYRQIKLALTLAESTVVILGYGLGDVNVLTALDWSMKVFSPSEGAFPHEVIQVLRVPEPSELPYRHHTGICVVEVAEIADFFEEYEEVRLVEQKAEGENRKALAQIEESLRTPTPENIAMFIDTTEFRRKLIKVLAHDPTQLASEFMSFLDQCINETWIRSSPNGAFGGYDQDLRMLLDILTGFDAATIPPALFRAVGYALARVAPYVGSGPGQSWDAGRTWDRRKAELSPQMVVELRSLAELYNYPSLSSLLGKIA